MHCLACEREQFKVRADLQHYGGGCQQCNISRVYIEKRVEHYGMSVGGWEHGKSAH